MKATCKEHEWKIGPLVDGELPPAEAEEAEGHLRTCTACATLAEEYRAFDRLAKRIEQPPTVTTFEWARVLERVRREPSSIPIGSRRRMIDWLVPALSLAALALLGAFVAIGIAVKEEVPPVSIEPGNPQIEWKVQDDATIIKEPAVQANL